jgi:hypothetical protein
MRPVPECGVRERTQYLYDGSSYRRPAWEASHSDNAWLRKRGSAICDFKGVIDCARVVLSAFTNNGEGRAMGRKFTSGGVAAAGRHRIQFTFKLKACAIDRHC